MSETLSESNEIPGQVTFDELKPQDSYSSAEEFIDAMRNAKSKGELFEVVDRGRKSSIEYTEEQKTEWSDLFDEKMAEFRKTEETSQGQRGANNDKIEKVRAMVGKAKSLEDLKELEAKFNQAYQNAVNGLDESSEKYAKVRTALEERLNAYLTLVEQKKKEFGEVA